MGMSGDMLASAVIALGAPVELVCDAMRRVARAIGSASVHAQTVTTEEGTGIRLWVKLETHDAVLAASDARIHLETAIHDQRLRQPYASFARRTLEILAAAEREAHSGRRFDAGQLELQAIGVAHTPYQGTAPNQPRKGDAGECHVELFPEFAAGLTGLESFSHVYLVAYLQRSAGYSLTVTPPWQEGGKSRRVGLFASRSPNRPSPLGFTLTEVRGIEENRLYTGPLDLFDGTPVVDIKPHLRSLDETDVGNDGWLSGSDHLQLHKEGIPHHHAGEQANLHEARSILLDVMGAATGLQFLGVSLADVTCLTPVAVGGGLVRFSHGTLPVPAPAVTAILKRYRVPHVAGPMDEELLTPKGAALLAALQPQWCPREMAPQEGITRRGLGLGTREAENANGLRLALVQR